MDLSVLYATKFPEYAKTQVLTADLVSIRDFCFPLLTSQSRQELSAAPDRKFFVSQSTSRHHTAPL